MKLTQKIDEIIERTKKDIIDVTNPWTENVLKEKLAGFEALKLLLIRIENCANDCGDESCWRLSEGALQEISEIFDVKE